MILFKEAPFNLWNVDIVERLEAQKEVFLAQQWYFLVKLREIYAGVWFKDQLVPSS